MPYIKITKSFSVLNGGGFTGVAGDTVFVTDEIAAVAQILESGELADGPADSVSAPEATESEVEEEPEVEGETEELELPKPYASKADWVAYGVAKGDNEEELKAMTKAQLQSHYGERL